MTMVFMVYFHPAMLFQRSDINNLCRMLHRHSEVITNRVTLQH